MSQYDDDNEDAPAPKGAGPQPASTPYDRFREDFAPIIDPISNAMESATTFFDKAPQYSMDDIAKYLTPSSSDSGLFSPEMVQYLKGKSPSLPQSFPSNLFSPSDGSANHATPAIPPSSSSFGMVNTDPVTDLMGQLALQSQQSQSNSTTTTPEGTTGSTKTSTKVAAKGDDGKVRGLATESEGPYFNVPANNLASLQNLQDAQQRASNVQLVNELGKAGETIGAALAHTKPVNQKDWEAQAKGGQGIVNDYLQQVQQQKSDPNSPLSEAFRQYANSLGVKMNGSMSASDAEQVFPFMFKGFELQQNRELKEKEFQEQEQTRRQLYQQHADMMKTLRGNQQTIQQQRMNNQAEQNFEQGWMRMKSNRNELGTPVQKVQMADTLDSILTKYQGHLDDVPNNLKDEWISAYNNYVTKGQGSDVKLRKLIANTGLNEGTKAWQWLTNHPTAAEQGPFIQMFLDSVHQQRDMAKAQVQDGFVKYLKSAQDRLTPGYVHQQLMNEGIDPNDFQNWKNNMYRDRALGGGSSGSGGGQFSSDIENRINNAMQTGATREQVIDTLRRHGVIP